MRMKKEENPPAFKTVPHTKGLYVATDKGDVLRVRAKPGEPPTFWTIAERMDPRGYIMVTINNVNTIKARAVAAAYGLIPSPWRTSQVIGYKDGDPTNTKLENLYIKPDPWESAREALRKKG